MSYSVYNSGSGFLTPERPFSHSVRSGYHKPLSSLKFQASPQKETSQSKEASPEESEKQPSPEESEKQPSMFMKVFVMLRPAAAFLGGLIYLLTVKELFSKKLTNPAWKFLESRKTGLAKQIEGAGGKFLASSSFVGGANMFLGGLKTQQTGMLLSGLLEVVPATLFFRAGKSQLLKHIAGTTENLCGAIFTLGLANEIMNKDPRMPESRHRRYDMTHFKEIISRKSSLSFFARVGGIFKEFGKMLVSLGQDNVNLVKNIWKTRFFLQPKNLYMSREEIKRKLHPTFTQRKEHWNQTWKDWKEHPGDTLKEGASRFNAWAHDPSAMKSLVAVTFFYLGTLPIVILTLLGKSKLGESKFFVYLKALGLGIANIPIFAIALNKHDFLGRGPLIGIPLQLLESNSAVQAFQGVGYIGRGFQEFFFSDVALHGVRTHDKEKPSNKITAEVHKIEEDVERHLPSRMHPSTPQKDSAS